MMKRSGNRFGTSASADAAAEASCACPDEVHIFADALILASFFVALLSLRLCAVMLLGRVILALMEKSSAAEEAEPVIII